MEIMAKVLVVDDEYDFSATLQKVIELKNLKVLIASNKIQAQKTIRREKPDLVILGTIAPRGDAFLLHQWLKRNKNFNGLPLIIIDAPPEKQLTMGWSKDEGLRLEAEEYFRKPIEPAALMPHIEKLLNRTSKRIKVLIADDHAVVREGIRLLLSLQKDIEVVGEAIDGKDAINKTLKFLPDVVLMDIVMPGMNGLEATKEICRASKEARVLMLTQYDDKENALACHQAGAFGLIPKRSASSHLLAGIRNVSRGENVKYTVEV